MIDKKTKNLIMYLIFLCFFMYVGVVFQSLKIAELKRDLQEQKLENANLKLKYKMLYRDPVVREAIESGG